MAFNSTSSRSSPRLSYLVSICSSIRRSFCHRGIGHQLNYSTPFDPVFSRLDHLEISPKNDDSILGRKWLAGSQGKGFPKFLAKPREHFPYALNINPSKHQKYSLVELASKCRETIDSSLTKYGAMLFRGLPLATADDFANFSDCLGYEAMDYKGGTAHRKIINKKSKVYNASDDPAEYTIQLHNELSYATMFPKKVMFFCLEAPQEGCGGHTVICDGKQLMASLNPELVQKLEDKQVKYWYCVPHEKNAAFRSWQDMFETEDKNNVEEFLTTAGFEYFWDVKDDSLQFWKTRPAFINHPDTGEKVWFNQLHNKHISILYESPKLDGTNIERVYRTNSYFGDGTKVEYETLQHVKSAMWKCSVGFQWKTGDLLILDNFLVLHGRLGFKGNRKILANLIKN